MLNICSTFALLLACTIPVSAQTSEPPGAEAPPDKSAYTLINPTPRELMRPLSTDRPDTTESPYTVDAGHIQVEMSFIEFVREDRGPRTDSISIAPVNFKIGLLNNVDLQLGLPAFERERVKGESHISGFGDTVIRVKVNLWGNDSGATAFGIMPFIKVPTGEDDVSNDDVEGGIILPFAADLPAGFGLGLMAELDFVRGEEDESYETEFVHTATVSHDLVGDLGAFIECVGTVSSDDAADYRATFNTGLTLGIGPDVQLDAGVGIGLTDDADDYRLYAGISFRY